MRFFAGQPLILWALALFFLSLGFTARIDIPLVILAVSASMAFGNEHRQPITSTLRNHWPLVFFLSIAILTTVFSVDSYHSLRVQPQLIPALLCYAVIVTFANNRKALEFVCVALLASGLITALFMLASTRLTPTGDPLAQVEILGNALLIVPNDAVMLTVIAPLAMGVCWTAGWHLRVMTAIYLSLVLVACVTLQSRQAVVLLLLGQLVVVTLMRPRWCIPILVVGIAAGMLVDGLMGWPLAHKIFMFPRIYVWHTAWVMFLDRPWTGQGPGMFKDLYFIFLERAGYILAELGDRRTMPWAHSLYFEQLAERGIFGLLALLCLLGSAMLRTYHLWRGLNTGSGKSLVAGGFSALIVMAGAGVAEATLSRLWVTVLLLVLVAFAYSSSCLLREKS
jgi:O-antigen ligase